MYLGAVKDVGQQYIYNLIKAADLIANKYRGYNETHSEEIINGSVKKSCG